MGKLEQRLKDAKRSGVYRVTRADAVEDASRASGLQLARIEFSAKELLLKKMAAALRLPEWFGHNWDALEDCLTALEGPGTVLLFERAAPGDDFGVLLDILRAAAESGAARGKPFFAVFLDPARHLPLPDLFRER